MKKEFKNILLNYSWNDKDLDRIDILTTNTKEFKTKSWQYWRKIYKTYYWILQRCNNKNNKDYKNYGWRWIKCEWACFEDFYKDMNAYCKKWLSIDRIDNDWNYSKDNCRWITNTEQQRNKRSNIMYEWKCLKEYCRDFNLPYKTIFARIKYYWRDMKKSVETKILKPFWNK